MLQIYFSDTGDCSVYAFTMRCLAAYNTEVLDRGSWLPGWNVTRNNITEDELSSLPSLDLAYIFQTEAALRGKSFWGKLTTYIGGGFVATLGNTLQVKQCSVYGMGVPDF